MTFLVQRVYLWINKQLTYTYVAYMWILEPLVLILTCSLWNIGVSLRIPLFSFKIWAILSWHVLLNWFLSVLFHVTCHQGVVTLVKCFSGTLKDSSNQFKCWCNLIASVYCVWTGSLNRLFTLAYSFLVEKWNVLLAYCTCKLWVLSWSSGLHDS